MIDPADRVMDLIFGRWRSQTLYAGVKLGVFGLLADGGRPTAGGHPTGVVEGRVS